MASAVIGSLRVNLGIDSARNGASGVNLTLDGNSALQPQNAS